MRSSDDIDWAVHFNMLSFHDIQGLPLRRLPPTAACSMVPGSVSWRLTWPNHDSLRLLTVDCKNPDFRQGYWPVPIYIRLFYAICVICRASSCSICFQKPVIVSPDLQPFGWNWKGGFLAAVGGINIERYIVDGSILWPISMSSYTLVHSYHITYV